jgi:hypothetical protein
VLATGVLVALGVTVSAVVAVVPASAWAAPSPPPGPTPTSSSSSPPASPATPRRAPRTAATFALQPVSPTDVATRRSDFRYQVRPGQRLVDSFELFNLSAQPQSFELYATNAYNTPAGGFALRPRSPQDMGVGSWVHLPESQTTLAPSTAQTVTFELSVPSDAPPGDYAGGVVALDLSPSSHSSRTSGFSLRQAVATAMFVQVTGALHPAAAIRSVRADVSVPAWAPLWGKSSARVAAVVTNTGNTVLRATVVLTLRGGLGHMRRTLATIDVAALVPGSTVTLTAPGWRRLAVLGPQQVVATLVATGVRIRRASPAFWVLPWGLIAGVAVVSALVVGLAVASTAWVVRAGRRRRARRAQRSSRGHSGRLDPFDLRRRTVHVGTSPRR